MLKNLKLVMSKSVGAIAFTIISAITYPVHADGSITGSMIRTTHVNPGSGFYFKTVEALENPDSCSGTAWYHLKSSSTYSKEMFSLLLAAHMSGRKVNFYLAGCSELGNYPLVHWINVEG